MTATNYEGWNCHYGLSRFGRATMVNGKASEGSLWNLEKTFGDSGGMGTDFLGGLQEK